MELLKKLSNWIWARNRGPLTPAIQKGKRILQGVVCQHGSTPKRSTFTIFDFEVVLDESSLCPLCTAAHLNKYSTLCGTCGEPIIPGDPVANKGFLVVEAHQYTHLQDGCCDSGWLYCGRWGEGKLVTIAELHPNIPHEESLRTLAAGR